ncbi:VWA-like domain-containing protein [Neobacillus bataviensis]|uniref:VWA-like domain-containing protein n=1 Tax=Neobacillus bataviensis TaxID=220685 RepID=UPI0003046E5E|nr:VWA-like domain-containing protein [Neobacillus bataviensis]
MGLKWHKTMLSMIQQRQDKKIALAVDTSTNEAPSLLINNIVKLFEQLKPDTILVQADFKIRSISPVKSDTIKYYTHGKSSYTLVLEWAKEENIDTLFYITDVTGFFSEEMEQVDFELFWLVPGAILPRVPFGKAIKVA